MAKQKMDFQVNLSLDFDASQSKLTELEERLEKLQMSDKGVGPSRFAEAKKIHDQLSKLNQQDTSKMSSDELLAREKEMNKLRESGYRILNSINGSRIKNLEKTKEQENALVGLIKFHKSIKAEIKGQIKALDELKDKTKKVSDAIVETQKKTGVGADILADPTKLDAEIKRRTKRDGTADRRFGTDKQLEGLKEYQKLIKETGSLDDLEKQAEKVGEELEKNYDNLKDNNQERQKITDEIIRQNQEAGNLNKEQADELKQTNKQLTTEEQITQEKEKQAAAEKAGDVKGAIKNTKELTKANNENKKSFLGKITAATLYYAALRSLRKLINSVVSTVRELDKSITQVAMVTRMNREEAWQLVGAYQELAYEVGATTDEIARLSVYFFRQGRAAQDALELTKVAATAAKVAAIDMTESANYLTSAINGFGMAATEAMAISDKFAALGASSASSYEEMAIALSKVAPVANTAGVGIDFMMGILAKGIETTREAPENIGTAFKTVFARMTQIRDFGATLDDATGVNTVEEALRQANVTLRDSEGQFRNMDAVLTDLGYAWDTLSRNQQAYIATALAGTRQQSRLLAVMQSFDRTMELVNISTNSAGATLAQHADYAGGMEAATARLTNSWEKLILAFSDTQVIIDIVDGLAKVLKEVANEVERNGPLIKNLAIGIGVALVGAFVGAKIAAFAATAAMKGFAVATTVATGGLNLLIAGAVAAIAAGIYLIFRKPKSEAEKLREESEKVSEAIKQNQVDIYNYRKSASHIKSLGDRYNELNKKVIKSAEEMEELNGITNELTEVLEKEYNVTITGEIDDELVFVLEQLSDLEKNKMLEQIEYGRELSQDYNTGVRDIESFDISDKESIGAYLAENMFGLDYIEATAEEQENMLAIIMGNFENYLDLYGDRLNDIKKINRAIQGVNSELSMSKVADAEIRLEAFSENKITGDGLQGVFKAFFEDLFVEYDDFIEHLQLKIDKDAEKMTYGDIIDYSKILMDSPKDFIDYTEDLYTKEGFRNFFYKELPTEIIAMRDQFDKLFKNTLEKSEQEDLWTDFFNLDEDSQKALSDSMGELAGYYAIGADKLESIVNRTLTNAEGDILSVAEKMSFAKALDNAGMNPEEIESFFHSREKITAAGIANYLREIENTFSEEESHLFDNLVTDLFDIFTEDADPQKFLNSIERMKTSVGGLMDLQKKYQEEGLNAEEFATVQEALMGTDLLDDFLAGTMTADQFMGTQKEELRKTIARAIDGVREELKVTNLDGGVKQILENELLMYEMMYENLDDMVYKFTDNIKDYYQDQIDYIQNINSELQAQIDLEQQRIDMNRSMLSLNRQIAALESDTSYGAQAQLADLRLTREQEAAERQKFIMDMIANQQIEQLQNEMQEAIENNTARTANATEELVDLYLRGGSGGFVTSIARETGDITNSMG